MRRKSGCAVLGALLSWTSLALAQDDPPQAPEGSDAQETPEGSTKSATLTASGAGVDATADTPAEPAPKESLLSDRIGIDVGVRVGYAVPFGGIAKVGPTEKRADGIEAAHSVFVTKQEMRTAFDGQLPLQLDLGFRITENFVVGLYGSWGKTFMSSSESPFNCADQPVAVVADPAAPPADPMAMDPAAAAGPAEEYDCSASALRAGVQARYHGDPNATVDPWVGVGFGFESMTVKNSTTSDSLTISGFEFLNVGVGLDLQLLDALRLGPYLQMSVGGYSSISDEQDLFVYGNIPNREQVCPGPQCAARVPDENVKLDEIHYWVTGGLRLSVVF